MAKGNQNLQIPVRNETKELFEDSYSQSSADSKGTFLKMLIDNWLDPDQVVEKPVEVQVENPETLSKLKEAEKNLEYFVSNPVLSGLFAKNLGKTFRFTDNRGTKREITISTIMDVFDVIMSKVEPEK